MTKNAVTLANCKGTLTTMISDCHVGVNDIDMKSGEDVYNEIKIIVGKLIDRFLNVKIIQNEVNPRADNKDSEVIRYKELIRAVGLSEKVTATTKH